MAAFSALGLLTILNAVHTPLMQSLPIVQATALPQLVPQVASELRFVSQPSSVAAVVGTCNRQNPLRTRAHTAHRAGRLAPSVARARAVTGAAVVGGSVGVDTLRAALGDPAVRGCTRRPRSSRDVAQCSRSPQLVPQVASEVKSVSQPSSAPPSAPPPVSGLQSPKSASQTGAHVPSVQTPVATLSVLQARSHAPQFAGDVSTLTHSRPHSVWLQSVVHTPLSQVSPAVANVEGAASEAAGRDTVQVRFAAIVVHTVVG